MIGTGRWGNKFFWLASQLAGRHFERRRQSFREVELAAAGKCAKLARCLAKLATTGRSHLMPALLWFSIGAATAAPLALLGMALWRGFSPFGSGGSESRSSDLHAKLDVDVAREMLDDTSRGLESLADSVGGELANLASGVVGNAELLCEAIGEPPLIAGRADKLLRSARRLRIFSEKILSFANTAQLHVRPLRVHDFLAGIGRELESYSGNGISVELETSEFLPPALVSEHELRNALMFLVDTLLYLESRASRVSLRAYAQISEYQDTRIEIEICAEAEDPNQPQRPVREAVQLGYLAARNLLAAQGATLGFKQLEGLSVSCFVGLQATDPIEIDDQSTRLEPPAVAAELPRTSHPYGGVLLLEGEESIRGLVAHELEKSGRNIVSCVDGAAARSLLEATPSRFELVVLDAEARLEDGISIARRALELSPEISILILENGKPHPLPEELQLPNVWELYKPFGIQELRKALLGVLEAKTTDSEIFASAGHTLADATEFETK